MVIRHISALVAAFLLAPSLFAVEVKLGPEVPVAEFSSKPAPIDRVAAASSGHDFLVAREETAGIFVTRVSSEGVAADPHGRFIAAGRSPKIASNGNGYLLAYHGAPGMQVLRLDENGAPLGQPRLFPGIDPVALLSNGSTYLFVFQDVSGVPGMILDSNGAPAANVVLHNFAADAGIGVHGGKYVAVDPLLSLTLYTISDDGSFTTTPFPRAIAPNNTKAAFAPNGILFAWTGAAPAYSVVGYDGSIIRLPNQLTAGKQEKLLAAEWDGHQFLTVFEQGEAFRIASDGTLLDSSPFPVALPVINTFTLASSGTKLLAAWPQSFGLMHSAVERVVRDFDELAAPHDTPAVIATVPAEQTNARMARGPRGNFAVWADATGYEVRAAINGVPILVDRATGNNFFNTPGRNVVGDPSVAAGAHVFLVVWWHSGNDRVSLYARRYDFDGRALDPQPVLLDTYGYGPTSTIAFDGTDFLVVWSRSPRFAAIRIGESGGPSEIRLVAPPLPFNDSTIRLQAARALWTGNRFLLAYTFDTIPQPPFSPQRFLALARIDATNSISSEPALTTFNNDTALTSSEVGATVANGRVTFAWTDAKKNIAVAQTALDGSLVRAPRVIVQRDALDSAADPEIGWNGAEYVVAWRDGSAVRAVRLDAELRLLDAAPFEVAQNAAGSEVSLLTTVTGVTIGYSRFDGALIRLFTRTLDRVGAEPRRRATGR